MTIQCKSKAYLSLGSNCDDASKFLAHAREEISFLPDLELEAISPLYATEPQDFTAQPWFLNQALAVCPGLSWTAPLLLQRLLDIEKKLGRIRSPDPSLRFGPRTIDIDLLLYGELSSTDENCLLPHPRLCQRAFVLIPLKDIAPTLRIGNKSLEQILAGLDFSCSDGKIFQHQGKNH